LADEHMTAAEIGNNASSLTAAVLRHLGDEHRGD